MHDYKRHYMIKSAFFSSPFTPFRNISWAASQNSGYHQQTTLVCKHAQDLGEPLAPLQSSLQTVSGFCPEKFCLSSYITRTFDTEQKVLSSSAGTERPSSVSDFPSFGQEGKLRVGTEVPSPAAVILQRLTSCFNFY